MIIAIQSTTVLSDIVLKKVYKDHIAFKQSPAQPGGRVWGSWAETSVRVVFILN